MSMFIDIARSRHSCRAFASSPLTRNEKGLILEAGGLAPSARNRRPVKLIPVEDADAIRALAGCKDSGTTALETASFAVIVAADQGLADTWVEDASIAATMMQLEAEDLGLGSCWIHIRLRKLDGGSAEEAVRRAAGVDPELGILCIVAFGRKA